MAVSTYCIKECLSLRQLHTNTAKKNISTRPLMAGSTLNTTKLPIKTPMLAVEEKKKLLRYHIRLIPRKVPDRAQVEFRGRWQIYQKMEIITPAQAPSSGDGCRCCRCRSRFPPPLPPPPTTAPAAAPVAVSTSAPNLRPNQGGKFCCRSAVTAQSSTKCTTL